jgi:hypothetical protein
LKIILSRKGFDGAKGRFPSPIFPDGRLLSLPIPAKTGPTRFADMRWREQNVGALVERLTRGGVSATRPLFLDPDLTRDSLPREPGWRPTLGQTGFAQSHLADHGVGRGDLFLFFGWFKEIEWSSGAGWRFRRNAPDLHVLFGWLQVGEVLRIGERTADFARRYPWLKDHPRLFGKRDPRDTLYIAAERLDGVPGSGLSARDGGGTFAAVSAARTLSDPDQPIRSAWRLPDWFYAPDGRLTLSRHESPEHWSRAPDGSARLRLVSRGQEFVLTTGLRREVADWLAQVFA